MKRLDELLAAENDGREFHRQNHTTAMTPTQKAFMKMASKVLGRRQSATIIRKAIFTALTAAIEEVEIITEENDDRTALSPGRETTL